MRENTFFYEFVFYMNIKKIYYLFKNTYANKKGETQK